MIALRRGSYGINTLYSSYALQNILAQIFGNVQAAWHPFKQVQNMVLSSSWGAGGCGVGIGTKSLLVVVHPHRNGSIITPSYLHLQI